MNLIDLELYKFLDDNYANNWINNGELAFNIQSSLKSLNSYNQDNSESDASIDLGIADIKLKNKKAEVVRDLTIIFSFYTYCFTYDEQSYRNLYKSNLNGKTVLSNFTVGDIAYKFSYLFEYVFIGKVIYTDLDITSLDINDILNCLYFIQTRSDTVYNINVFIKNNPDKMYTGFIFALIRSFICSLSKKDECEIRFIGYNPLIKPEIINDNLASFESNILKFRDIQFMD